MRINRQLDLWERGTHAGLVRDALAEGRAQEGRVERRVEEEEDLLAHNIDITVLSGKLWQEVCWATDRWGGGGGFILLGVVCTNTGRLVADFLQEKHTDICVSLVENPMCAVFEE